MNLALRAPLPEPSPARPRLRVLPALPPRTRGDCIGGERPCRWTRCRYHLDDMKRRPGAETCALDVADRRGASLYEVAAILGVSHQAVSQLQQRAVQRFSEAAERLR